MPQASLCFIIRGDHVLLIRKKRGVGAGKINGPGGKVEAGESMLDSAVRETREEVGVTPRNLALRGEMFFNFVGAHVVHCGIFLSQAFDGTPVETEEAIPIWHGIATMPYDEMWDDDRVWFPFLLAGRYFRGSATVDAGDYVRDIHVGEIDPRELEASCGIPTRSSASLA